MCPTSARSKPARKTALTPSLRASSPLSRAVWVLGWWLEGSGPAPAHLPRTSQTFLPRRELETHTTPMLMTATVCASGM